MLPDQIRPRRCTFPISDAVSDPLTSVRPVQADYYVLSRFTALAFGFAANTVAVLAGIFFIAGLYVAVQEALESTVTAGMVRADTLATSYGALGTVNGTAKFVSSTAVGLLWTTVSPAFAFTVAATFMAAGTLVLARVGARKPGCIIKLSSRSRRKCVNLLTTFARFQ